VLGKFSSPKTADQSNCAAVYGWLAQTVTSTCCLLLRTDSKSYTWPVADSSTTWCWGQRTQVSGADTWCQPSLLVTWPVGGTPWAANVPLTFTTCVGCIVCWSPTMAQFLLVILLANIWYIVCLIIDETSSLDIVSKLPTKVCCYCFTNSLVHHVVFTNGREMKLAVLWWPSNYDIIYGDSWFNRCSERAHTHTHINTHTDTDTHT